MGFVGIIQTKCFIPSRIFHEKNPINHPLFIGFSMRKTIQSIHFSSDFSVVQPAADLLWVGRVHKIPIMDHLRVAGVRSKFHRTKRGFSRGFYTWFFTCFNHSIYISTYSILMYSRVVRRSSFKINL